MLPLLVYLKSVHKVNEWLGNAYIYIWIFTYLFNTRLIHKTLNFTFIFLQTKQIATNKGSFINLFLRRGTYCRIVMDNFIWIQMKSNSKYDTPHDFTSCSKFHSLSKLSRSTQGSQF